MASSFDAKLRIRHYGAPPPCRPTTAGGIEIKQRSIGSHKSGGRCYTKPSRCAVDMTSKLRTGRRVVVRRSAALGGVDLRPSTALVTREDALRRREEDAGLRVTFDARVRARDRTSDLSIDGENRFIVHPDLSVLEVSQRSGAHWLPSSSPQQPAARADVEVLPERDAFERKPRSLFHSIDDDLYEWSPIMTSLKRSSTARGPDGHTFSVADITLAMVCFSVLCAVSDSPTGDPSRHLVQPELFQSSCTGAWSVAGDAHRRLNIARAFSLVARCRSSVPQRGERDTRRRLHLSSRWRSGWRRALGSHTWRSRGRRHLRRDHFIMDTLRLVQARRQSQRSRCKCSRPDYTALLDDIVRAVGIDATTCERRVDTRRRPRRVAL